MPRLETTFKPAWWLRGQHAQTVWPSLFRRRAKLDLVRERVELPDGDFIDLSWSGPVDGPIVLFLHGLEGSLRSHYATGMMHALNRRGMRACFMHFRGCSDEPNRLPISYHSGKTDDPLAVLRYIEKEYARPVYGAIGVSLGGNVLLKLLGEMAGDVPLQRAAAMSVPFVLDDAARRLNSGFSRLYERYLIGNLQQRYRRKFSRIPAPLDLDVGTLRTFHRFDDAVTAPLHGFANVDDYYTRCSSRQFIHRIRVPTLILHSRDDPLMYPETAPDPDECSDQVHLELCDHGGHVGFVSGRFPGHATYWGEQRIADWLADGLDTTRAEPRPQRVK
jgi:predicted alpha/beta-fold hydrolase